MKHITGTQSDVRCIHAYYMGGNCPNDDAQVWTMNLLEDFPRSTRTIMHGLMLYQGTDGTRKSFEKWYI